MVHKEAPIRTCYFCLYNCKIPPSESGLCGRIFNDSGSLMIFYPRKLYFHESTLIEAVHVFHYWPGSKISVILFHRDVAKRFPFLEFSSIELGGDNEYLEFLSLLKKKDVKGVFIGGLEPLIYLGNTESIKESLLYFSEKNKRFLITETFFLSDLEALKDTLSLFDVVSLNILFSKSCLNQFIPCPDQDRLMKYVDLFNSRGIHFEVNIIPIEEISSFNELEVFLTNLLSTMDKSTPIHILRFRYFENKRKSVSIKLLERLRRLLKLRGFEFVYVDELYISRENRTYLSSNRSSYIERFGPWIKSIKNSRLVEGIVRGSINDTYPLEL